MFSLGSAFVFRGVAPSVEISGEQLPPPTALDSHIQLVGFWPREFLQASYDLMKTVMVKALLRY